jgi:hypothetical protein
MVKRLDLLTAIAGMTLLIPLKKSTSIRGGKGSEQSYLGELLVEAPLGLGPKLCHVERRGETVEYCANSR